MNVGFFAKYGSKLYFTDANDGKLYEIDSDGTERVDNAIRWFAQTGKFMSIVPGNKIVSKIQIKATVPIFERHANLKYKFGNRNFWATGYYVSTVGINTATIQKYIREQEKQDQIEDSLSKKEYIDPFKGSK